MTNTYKAKKINILIAMVLITGVVGLGIWDFGSGDPGGMRGNFSGSVLTGKMSDEEAMDRDNAEVAAIVRDINENGPPELRQLSSSVITDAVSSIVFGRRTGAISSAELARMGGVRGIVESSLRGQMTASGLR